jgi:hypothetical protein
VSEPDLDRMRVYADAAKEHPTWSVAYAEDVPMLLDEIDHLRSKLGENANSPPPFRDLIGYVEGQEGKSHRTRKAESDLALCRAEALRLRAWLERISTAAGPAAPFQVWADQALAGEKP